MGETGPCGPCSEIHYFVGGEPDIRKFGEEPTPDGRGWVEIWNLVFMQFERSIIDGVPKLELLPAPCVDTGAGLERLSAVLQGVRSNYDTDLLRALVEQAATVSGKTYRGTQADDDTSMRVIADHARLTAFLIAEGITPDRDGRSYVLRRVMRRAIRHGHRLGIDGPFLHQVALSVVDLMGDCYPELRERRDMIADLSQQEEVRFRQTLDRGIKMLDDEFAVLRSRGERVLVGDTAFRLYDTYGFPIDLTQLICEERAFQVDMAGYDEALRKAKALSEGSAVGDAAVGQAYYDALTRVPGKNVRFAGYEQEALDGCKVVALVCEGALVEQAAVGEKADVILDATPFYGQAGGQVGDVGRLLRGETEAALVRDTLKPLDGLWVHKVKVLHAPLKLGDMLTAEVDHDKREATRRNHSATHLLHYALRKVLGAHAQQKGSLVGPDRLRFDFTHGKAVEAEELQRIEDLVNEKVLANAPVQTRVLGIDEAKKLGAMAIFEEKYGEVVRVLTITPDSVELCGGTHARASGDIGLFKILSEAGIAAGVRRIEAVTGRNALQYVRGLESTLRRAARMIKADIAELPEKVERLSQRERELDKQVAELKRRVALGAATNPKSGASGGPSALCVALGSGTVQVVPIVADVADPKILREVADEKLNELGGTGMVIVGSGAGGKAMIVVKASKDVAARVAAGDVVRLLAQKVGGSGGGRPDMAQAGGPNGAALAEAMSEASVTQIVQAVAKT
jgi:alanyl-tRNA synthetase